METTKTIKAKPQFYAACLQPLQKIAREIGYNLIIHGSMNRDMDLVAIPWVDEPKSHLELLNAFAEYLGTRAYEDWSYKGGYMHSVLGGGRDSYVINLHRTTDENRYEDAQYYLDISITPLITK